MTPGISSILHRCSTFVFLLLGILPLTGCWARGYMQTRMVPTAQERPNPFIGARSFTVLPLTMELSKGELPPPVEPPGAPPKFKSYPWTWSGLWAPSNLESVNETTREIWRTEQPAISSAFLGTFLEKADKLGLAAHAAADGPRADSTAGGEGTKEFFVRPAVATIGSFFKRDRQSGTFDRWNLFLVIIRVTDRDRLLDEIRIVAQSPGEAGEATATYLQRRTMGQEPQHQGVFFLDKI